MRKPYLYTSFVRIYHVNELQNAANPITTVPITKRTLLKLESKVGGVWFLQSSPVAGVTVKNRLLLTLCIVFIVLLITSILYHRKWHLIYVIWKRYSLILLLLLLKLAVFFKNLNSHLIITSSDYLF